MIKNAFNTYRDKLDRDYFGAYIDYAEGLDTDSLMSEIEKISENKENKSPVILMAETEAFILKNARISVDPYEYFAGALDGRDAALKTRDLRHRFNMKFLAPYTRPIYLNGINTLSFTAAPDFGHTAADWDSVMKLGFSGMLERIRQNASKMADNGKEKADFYKSCEIVYEGIFAYIDRLSSLAERVSALQEDSFARDNLIEVAKTLRNLAKRPPQTLREAMQMTFLYYSIQHRAEGVHLRTLGPVDALFYPFMKSDIEKGLLDEEGVREYMRAFLYTCYTEKAVANMPFAIAGLYKNGESRANRLSYILLEEYIGLNIIDPKIHFCYSSKTPDDLIELALESVRKGRNSIVFINCDVASDALTALGEDREDTIDFTIVGCYEIAAYGKEVPCTCNGCINLPKALEAAIFNGKDLLTGKVIGPETGDAESFTTFDDLYKAYRTQCEAFADEVMHMTSSYESYYPLDVISPVLSSTYADSVAKGIDAFHGGAKYNNSSINAFGSATMADSLIAIKKLVFEEKKLTLKEFADILAANWEGHGELHSYVLSKMPKYGNNIAEVDFFVKDTIDFLGKKINGHPNGRGGVFRLGTFSIDWRFTFGAKTAASANGRLSGETLSKNMCATTACDLKGVTAHILSACAPNYTNTPNGTVLDLLLHSSAARGEDGMKAMLALLKTFMIKRGFAVQFNVLSLDTLRAAQKEPEKYKTLQVRLCGWNVLFCNLSKKEQDEYILQCEKTGNL
ncbi:MAG: hypothetical protein E7633_10315 [Ruminococcaceae bacterium]|nr:hypothetical protein [Oscillospiraceae bacterium]